MRLRRLVYIGLALFALWIFAGYLATVPVVGNHAYWRAFRAIPSAFGLKAQDVSFTSIDGVQLKGWYIPAGGAAHGTVILAHGINGNRSDMLPRAAFLVRDGYNTLLIDLRDHGESGGTYSGPGYMESLDVLGAIHYLQTRQHQEPIILMGHSYGAVAVLYAAARSTIISAVIADSAYISFDDLVKRATSLLAQDPERSFWERLGLWVAGFRAVERAAMQIYYLRTGVWVNTADSVVGLVSKENLPILFVAGQRDRICPPQDTELMYRTAQNPKKELLVVPGAEHDSTYTTDLNLYEATVVAFLNKALQKEVSSCTFVGRLALTTVFLCPSQYKRFAGDGHWQRPR